MSHFIQTYCWHVKNNGRWYSPRGATHKKIIARPSSLQVDFIFQRQVLSHQFVLYLNFLYPLAQTSDFLTVTTCIAMYPVYNLCLLDFTPSLKPCTRRGPRAHCYGWDSRSEKKIALYLVMLIQYVKPIFSLTLHIFKRTAQTEKC